MYLAEAWDHYVHSCTIRSLWQKQFLWEKEEAEKGACSVDFGCITNYICGSLGVSFQTVFSQQNGYLKSGHLWDLFTWESGLMDKIDLQINEN